MLDRGNLSYLLFLGNFSLGKDIILYVVWVMSAFQS